MSQKTPLLILLFIYSEFKKNTLVTRCYDTYFHFSPNVLILIKKKICVQINISYIYIYIYIFIYLFIYLFQLQCSAEFDFLILLYKFCNIRNIVV